MAREKRRIAKILKSGRVKPILPCNPAQEELDNRTYLGIQDLANELLPSV